MNRNGSRAASRSLDDAGFTLDEFAALLSKYDYNFKPGDIVNGTVFALESKGAMIDIGAKTEGRVALKEFTGPGREGELKVGDEVEVAIDGLGALTNTIKER